MADPVHSAGTDPSFGGAIVALMRALSSSFAPRGLVQRPQVINGAVEQAAGAPQGAPSSGGLGNQSPGLGNSF